MQVPHGNSPELVLSPVSVKDSGFYICRVNSESSFMFSRWARLEVCELQDTAHGEWQKPLLKVPSCFLKALGSLLLCLGCLTLPFLFTSFSFFLRELNGFAWKQVVHLYSASATKPDSGGCFGTRMWSCWKPNSSLPMVQKWISFGKWEQKCLHSKLLQWASLGS